MLLLKGHRGVVRGLAFSHDGSLLASVGNDKTVRVWHCPSGAPRFRFRGPRHPKPSLAFSPDGRWLAFLNFSGAWVGDLHGQPTWLPTSLLLAREGKVPQGAQALAFSADGRLVVGGTRGSSYDQQRWGMMALNRSWKVGSWTELPAADFKIKTTGVWDEPWALEPRSLTLAAPDWMGVAFWDMKSRKELFRLPARSNVARAPLAFSPDGRRFAVARSYTITVGDVARRKVVATWMNPKKHVRAVAFSPDGRTLATGDGDGVVRLWDAATGQEKVAFAWEIGPPEAIAFSPDGMRAAVAGKKGDILVWDVE
jgi:WD40 repeat protein